MDQIPGWLNDVVLAAGMTTVYIADDWEAGHDAGGSLISPLDEKASPTH